MIVPARGTPHPQGSRAANGCTAHGESGNMPERKRTWNSRKKTSLKRWA
nr:MAG TPA: hypothetical protein [Caudoviricetes sp.]